MADIERSQAERIFDLPVGSFPFASDFIENRGVRLNYVEAGTGPTVLMVHGNPTWSYIYRHLIRELSSDFRCIAVDLPGFGLSVAPDDFDHRPESHADMIEDLLICLDLKDVTLIAHDWGGPIGIAAGLKTGRVSRLCLGNTWAWAVNGDFHFEWFSRLMGGPVGRFGTLRHAMFINMVMPMSMKRRKLSDLDMKAYRAPFDVGRNRQPMIVMPQQILAAGEWLGEIEKMLRGFDGPAHLIWPMQDMAFRDRERRRWLDLLPQATQTVIERCGHYLWEDAPSEAAFAVKKFLLD